MTGGPAGLPWPEGDPGAVRGAGRRLESLAGEVEGAAGRIVATADVGGWEGPAAVVYRAAAGAQVAALRAGTGPVSAAASQLTSLATALDDARDEIRRLADKVRDAEDAAQRAQDAVTTARAAEPTDPLLGSTLGTFPSPEVAAAMGAASRAADRAAQVRADAEAKAQTLVDRVERLDRATASVVDAATAAAPAGGAAPTSAAAPPAVRRFAPTMLFSPEEEYLPADLDADWREYLRTGDLPDDLGGIGPGAPLYYNYDRDARRIDYLHWRRYNDFRNMGLPGGVHYSDLEGIHVQLGRDGQPLRVAYRQHDGPPCTLEWPDVLKDGGRPIVYPALGSGAGYPRPGSYDEVPGPFDDLAGGKPGGGDVRVDGRTDLRDLRGKPYSGEEPGEQPRLAPDGFDGPQRPFDQLPDGPIEPNPCPEPNGVVE